MTCELHHYTRRMPGGGRASKPRAKYEATLRANPQTVYRVCGVHMGRSWRRDPRWIVRPLDA